MTPQLVLASASPRRTELLRQIGLEFEVYPSTVDEDMLAGLSPAEAVRDVAVRKCLDVARHRPSAIVIGADTAVVLGSEILGKPSSAADAARMLRLLSGRHHQVITGLALVREDTGWRETCSVCTSVRFRDLTDRAIECYVATGEPMDKAGAYAIQGRAAVFAESIDGCYFNVVGLPVSKLAAILDGIGMSIPLYW